MAQPSAASSSGCRWVSVRKMKSKLPGVVAGAGFAARASFAALGRMAAPAVRALRERKFLRFIKLIGRMVARQLLTTHRPATGWRVSVVGCGNGD